MTCMLGAVCGDIAGSIYEFHNIKHKPAALIEPGCRFTDDTVMTLAVAEGIRNGLRQLPENWMEEPSAEGILLREIQTAMQHYGRNYPHAGYGGRFRSWLRAANPQPYNSWGNGSAMRASFAGWAANSLAEAEKLGTLSAMVTHDHPEGIKGAQVTAGSIFLLRNGGSKAELEAYASRYYNLDFTLDEIRPTYRFDVSCHGSVPQAIKAVLEETSYADVISAAISIGGDSDTIAAIAGSIAEPIYSVPEDIAARARQCLDPFLTASLDVSIDWLHH